MIKILMFCQCYIQVCKIKQLAPICQFFNPLNIYVHGLDLLLKMMKVLAKRSLSVFHELAYILSPLVQCANAAIKSKKCTYFKIRYDQIKKRRGHKKAIIAIAHTLLNCIYRMLYRNETFNYDLYSIDSKPKQTYATQLTEEMAIRYLQM